MTAAPAVSWIPLMKLQSRPRNIGYDMPVTKFATGAAAQAHSAAAHERLRQIKAAPLPEPRLVVQQKPLEPLPVIPDTVPLNMLAPCSWRFLLRLAILRHGLSKTAILGQSQTHRIVKGRDEAVALIYQHTQASMPYLASIFSRDHSTIHHSLVKTGARNKLVEMLPHVAAARRTRKRNSIVIAVLSPYGDGGGE